MNAETGNESPSIKEIGFMKSTASSIGITFANLKNADCKIVFVRLPIPISIALSIALMVYN